MERITTAVIYPNVEANTDDIDVNNDIDAAVVAATVRTTIIDSNIYIVTNVVTILFGPALGATDAKYAGITSVATIVVPAYCINANCIK